ncbi:MAG: aminopeptidase N [Gammaproteobacteria bacterium]|nr:aminopeptidase N [Gammaproteobacteria bacterium]
MNTIQTSANTPQPICLGDYRPPDYQIISIDLRFELTPSRTVVSSELVMAATDPQAPLPPLRLDGEALELLAISLNGEPLAADAYAVDATGLTLFKVPPQFTLSCQVALDPQQNSALEGLYISGGNFTTQCEAEGFRRITYYIDRPDVMALFTTTLVAPRQSYPTLLSNGNCVASGDLEDGRHFATWHDPFPKPCYLFALVAGNLRLVSDHFVTRSGRQVALQIYVEPGNEHKCDHAMASLKQAMRWDEEQYGCEYDLDNYMIVAVSDFNMGAMENKGLNIFNAGYVMACPETATDNDYLGIQGVIAHEYFHNWSGNRVTCRDWFQLSLKEGFTVFRDQQFSAEMNSAAVKRIDDVRLLRTYQFAEDAGPMAHPVRPPSYLEINNFYTLTVYEKGAELVRMIHTLLGRQGFRRGSDLYFSRHDGQAVTCDQLLQAMADANNLDLGHFSSWYSQAGTPRLRVTRRYDAATCELRLLVEQLPPVNFSGSWQTLPIPFNLGLVGADGSEVPLELAAQSSALQRGATLLLSQTTSEIVLQNVPPGTVPSLLRNFSAPIKLESDISEAELAQLMAHDSDAFNRWDAGQQLGEAMVLRSYYGEATLDAGFSDAFGALLADDALEPALKSEALALPDMLYLLEQIPAVDPQRLYATIKGLERQLVGRYQGQLVELYSRYNLQRPYSNSAEEMGRRRLKNRMLAWLSAAALPEAMVLAKAQYHQANNMTDALAALTQLVHQRDPERQQLLESFKQRWLTEPLVIDKWFAIQATTPDNGCVEEVLALSRSEEFTLRNPNRVRSLVASFGMRNPNAFHRPDGAGYRFMTDTIIELDRSNPQIASRLMTPLTFWHRYDDLRQALMSEQLQRIAQQPKLSRDVQEVVQKSLAKKSA